MQIKFKKTHQNAKAPQYATDGSGCFDLYAVSVETSHAAKTALYATGLSFEIPQGYAMLVFSRSGQGFKSDIRLANCVGVIDSDYRGEVKVKLTADGETSPLLDLDLAVAQAAIVKLPRAEFLEVNELSKTERGSGGFGHTDKLLNTQKLKLNMTPVQARRMEEFDFEEKILEQRLSVVREKRREYINTNDLNKN